jgi:hypothetical protein
VRRMGSPESFDVLAKPLDTGIRSVHCPPELPIIHSHKPDITETGVNRRSASSRVAPNAQAVAVIKVSRRPRRMAGYNAYLNVTTICVCVLCTQWSGT